MKLAFVESEDRPISGGLPWDGLIDRAAEAGADALLLNEMPAGRWLAAEPSFDPAAAKDSIAEHDALLQRFEGAPFHLLGTRPVPGTFRLRNEAFSFHRGHYRAVRHKAKFPSEEGFFERHWFDRESVSLNTIKIGSVSFGFMICSELMFIEYARAYAKNGAEVIVVPRATAGSLATWKTAASMAAIVSGCYVVSSNRRGGSSKGLNFNGGGFAFGPDGQLLRETSPERPVELLEIDKNWIQYRRKQYPCYLTLED